MSLCTFIHRNIFVLKSAVIFLVKSNFLTIYPLTAFEGCSDLSESSFILLVLGVPEELIILLPDFKLEVLFDLVLKVLPLILKPV